METRVKANPEILGQRRELVEHPFGSIKQWMNQGAFLTRGLEKVRAEFSLTALAYNMTRVLKIVGARQSKPVTRIPDRTPPKGVQKRQKPRLFDSLFTLCRAYQKTSLFFREQSVLKFITVSYLVSSLCGVKFSHGLNPVTQQRKEALSS